MKRGDIVEVCFLDHCQNAKEPLEFVAWGRVVRINKKSIALQTWGHPDNLECDTQTEGYCLIKSCFTKSVRVLH